MKLTARYPEPSLGSSSSWTLGSTSSAWASAWVLVWVQNLQEELWESSALTFVQQSKAEGFGSRMPSWPNWLHGTSLENEERGTPGGFYPLKHPVYMCCVDLEKAVSCILSDVLWGYFRRTECRTCGHGFCSSFLETEWSFLLRYNLLPSVTLQDQRLSYVDRSLL